MKPVSNETRPVITEEDVLRAVYAAYHLPGEKGFWNAPANAEDKKALARLSRMPRHIAAMARMLNTEPKQ